MLYVTMLEEAAAADAARINLLSIEGHFYSPEMREAKVSTYWQTIVKDPPSWQ
jgi:3-methyl-2-oxobutanoate hydroxymethyltransferase